MAEVTPRLFMEDIVEIEFLVQYHLLVINYFFSFARMNHVQLQVLKFFGTERHKVIKDVMSQSSVIFFKVFFKKVSFKYFGGEP